ncbi:sucrose-6-phosphate hydrolase [Liquorilactobacillus sucicola DSM 21376 = JCM 15457]|uniref:Sucrose-6-phosphate hydrolase n=1 Tax=Liquorilactobacillus sucicola DSM 21376 = JCM 15457 TaxID=1423806 RepID=A0A023CXQ9_9LACO|nr:sucrose-6-phosphate hydrolase [Liquorilactobacillus sucicola]KRN07701.1 sucrose-6-phosphate hydrolase [Liquorilactobacillus sucicola DSM 21376 = JCM 15457]GAJ26662.1 sucrose-6-phosphate hydrolase [Liquorilactobacillus sucicola DSM 21376 = JCM 15457]
MEWTRAKRYLPYSAWSADKILNLQQQTAASDYRFYYHIGPTSGLLNDPNGFSFFNGQWHLFYQSFPFGAVHGLKSWFHLVSDDLIHWDKKGITLKPDSKYDSHGAYSGSARVINDKLFIMYTGNVRDNNWQRHPYQNGAWLDKDNHLTKLSQPLFGQPAHTTDHFRDPQLLELNGTYYALLGAQDKDTLKGQIALFSSSDLKEWKDLGYLKFTTADMGYMIECPSLVFVENKPILIFCPQGLNKEVTSYENIYPNVFILGDTIDLNKGTFTALNTTPHNLDDGFDVYATQAFNAPDGKAYAVSWVGLPDISYPTDGENWAHCLSQVKELHIKNGKLHQRPVPAMASLRTEGKHLSSNNEKGKKTFLVKQASQHYELKLTLPPQQNGKLHLAATEDLAHSLELEFSTGKNAFLNVKRQKAGTLFAEKYGTKRSLVLDANKTLNLDIFFDNSVCEIFVNDGLNVLTLRLFPQRKQDNIILESNSTLNYNGTWWNLKKTN